MPKRIARKVIPNKENKFIRKFDNYLTKESFSYQRIPILKSFLIGVFIAFIPIPFQMLVIGILCILFRANIIIGITLAWITNPITMPFIFFIEYKIGSFLLNGTPLLNIEETFKNFDMNSLGNMILEMYIGGFILGAIASLLSFLLMLNMWKGYLFYKKYNKNKGKTLI